MPAIKLLNERDTKLVQWLNEAHAKEAELEADLKAHIALTQKAAYKKRLQQHLKETRDHKRSVARRIKAIGGRATAGVDVPGVPTAVSEATGKTVAAVKGQVGAGAGDGHLAARDPPAQRPGGAARGAGRDRHLHARGDVRHRGRRQGDGAAGQDASVATRSAWRSSSPPSSPGWSRTWSATRSRVTSAPRSGAPAAARRPARARRDRARPARRPARARRVPRRPAAARAPSPPAQPQSGLPALAPSGRPPASVIAHSSSSACTNAWGRLPRSWRCATSYSSEIRPAGPQAVAVALEPARRAHARRPAGPRPAPSESRTSQTRPRPRPAAARRGGSGSSSRPR